MNLRYVRSLDRWQVNYRLNNRQFKRTFRTKSQAEGHRSEINGIKTKAHETLAALKTEQQADLVDLLEEAKEGGFTLRDAVKTHKLYAKLPPKVYTLKQCFDDFMAEKKSMRLAYKSLKALNSTVGRFVNTGPLRPITQVTRESVMAWLQRPSWGPTTFNTYLTALNTFFLWCVHCERLSKSPTAKIKKIKKSQMPGIDEPPAILDTDQLQRLLLAAWYQDREMIRPVALGAFGGTRPENESRNLHREDFQDKQILIRGANAKDRTRRYIDINPTLKAWLDLCPKLKPITNFRRRFELLRAQAGLIRWKKTKGRERKEVTWTGWGQDCLRHTFASNYLPVHGADKTVEQLGHGDYNLLFSHYRALRSKAEAEAFWAHFLKLAKRMG